VLPPPTLVEQIENRKGRKSKPKRKKGKNESPSKKKKLSKEKRIMHCRQCGHSNHNESKCRNIRVEKYMTPRKKKTSNTNAGEGSSQATQASQPTQIDLFSGLRIRQQNIRLFQVWYKVFQNFLGQVTNLTIVCFF